MKKKYNLLILCILTLILFTTFQQHKINVNSINTEYGEGGYYTEPDKSSININNLFHLVPNSSSKVDSVYNNVALLTKDENNKVGGLYSLTPVDLSKPFTIEGNIYIGPGKNGIKPYNAQADGMAFILQNDDRGLDAYSNPGADLGYQDYGGENYIHRAVAFEMDTYFNSGRNDKDLSTKGPHVAWVLPENNKHYDPQIFTSTDLNHAIYGTSWQKFKINFIPDGNSATLTGTFGDKISSLKIDDIASRFGGTKAYWGLTGSTGLYYEVQALEIDKIIPSPAIIATKNVYDLSGKDINGTNVTQNTTLDYRISATNQGTGSAQNTTFYDSIPNGTTIVPNSGYFIDTTGKKIDIPLDINDNKITFKNSSQLPIGSSCSFGFKVKVNGKSSTITNTARLIADNYTYDTNKVNNYLEKDKPSIEKLVKNESLQNSTYNKETVGFPGDKLSYRIRIFADKANPLKEVQLQDALPSGFVADHGVIKLVENGNNKPSHYISATNLSKVIDIDSVLGKDGGPIDSSQTSYVELKIHGQIKPSILQNVSSAEIPFKIKNTVTITHSSYGDNDGKGWTSDPALVDLQALKSKVTKKVKLAKDDNNHYVDQLDVSVGDELNYKVSVTSDAAHLANLDNVELKDNFNGKLGTDLSLKDITVHYFDANNHEITAEKENLTPDTQNTIHLSHPIIVGGHAEVIYNVTVNQNASEDTVPNTAVIAQDSYGPNNPDNKRDGWFSNPATIKISSIGKVIFRYIDRKSNMKNPTQIADTVTVSGPIGKKVSAINAEPMRPKHIKGWTVIDATQTADLTNATFFQAEKLNPIIAKQDQVITYRYEKAMISLSAPETWNFGKYLNTQRDAIYYLPATRNAANQEVPSGVNVEDYFGTDSWTLSVQQTGQFKSQADPKSHDLALRHAHELTGAQLQFNNALLKKIAAHEAGTAKDVVNNLSHFTLEPAAKQSTTVVTYSKKGRFDQHVATDSDGQKYDDPGWNVWRYQFGRQQQADYSVGLHVPATTKRYKTHYQADLTWTLAIAP